MNGIFVQNVSTSSITLGLVNHSRDIPAGETVFVEFEHFYPYEQDYLKQEKEGKIVIYYSFPPRIALQAVQNAEVVVETKVEPDVTETVKQKERIEPARPKKNRRR